MQSLLPMRLADLLRCLRKGGVSLEQAQLSGMITGHEGSDSFCKGAGGAAGQGCKGHQ